MSTTTFARPHPAVDAFAFAGVGVLASDAAALPSKTPAASALRSDFGVPCDAPGPSRPGVPCDALAASPASMSSSDMPMDRDTAAASSSAVSKCFLVTYGSSSGAKHCTSSFSVTTSMCSMHSGNVMMGTFFRSKDPPFRMASESALTTSLWTTHRIWPVGSPTTMFMSPNSLLKLFKIATHRRWHRVVFHPPSRIHAQFVFNSGLVGSNWSTSIVSSARRHDPSLNAQCSRRLICQ